MDVAKKIVDLLAGIAVIFTLVFIGLQWNEMRKGGEDTKALAKEAKAQADASKLIAESAKSQADNTDKLAKDTHQLAVAAGNQATATGDLARQAARSANTAKEALQSSIELSREDGRPWVGLQAVQCNGCTIEADRSLKVGELLGVIANTGRTPALQMIVH